MKKKSLEEVLALVIENVVFLVAAVVLFLRTSELFAIFAPRGMSDAGTAQIYGWVSAGLVEGLLVAVKFTLPHIKRSEAYAYNAFLILVTFAISAAAQLADGYIIRDTLSRQSPAVQWLIQVGVPLVLSLILLAVAGKSIVEHAPQVGSQNMPTKAARFPSQVAAEPAMRQYSENVATPAARRNELAAEDWQYVAAHSTRQIAGRYGISGRTARDWKKSARTGKTE
jgi:hypothetical protein